MTASSTFFKQINIVPRWIIFTLDLTISLISFTVACLIKYNFDFSEGLVTIWKEIAWANKLIDDAKPWELVKTDPEKVKTLLLSLSALLLEIALRLSPVMPETAQKIKSVLESGDIKKPEPLFQKID